MSLSAIPSGWGGHARSNAQGRRDESGYTGRAGSPVGLGGAIAVHLLAVGAFLLIPAEIYEPFVPDILTTHNVPADPVPLEAEPDTPPKADIQKPVERTDVPVTIVPVPAGDSIPRVPDIPLPPVSGDGGGDGGVIAPANPAPMPEPVLVDAQIDPRALPAFQPDYPGAMIRLGEEGRVTVRVTIGTDGRVSAIEPVTASNEAFWIATRRHALKAWRFRPATRDGVPVVATMTLTVYFKLADR
ncbi:MAG: TonB family protein [Sphingobium sp.]|nr:TonB family protein [Sphingobium sp.]